MHRVGAWTREVSDRQLLLWAALALINLASAFTVWRTTDFDTMHVWTSEWLWHGVDLYGSDGWATDYPPSAVVVLAPLALLNAQVSASAWALLNVVLLAASGVLCARTIGVHRSWRSTALLLATLFCWSASRTLLQFTIAALVCALASWRLASTRPMTAGVLLGLALMKPQVAVPYILVIAATRRWRVVSMAAATTAALWGIYCLRVGVGPLAVASHYGQRMIAMYSGPHAQVGVSELARLAPGGYEDLVGAVTALTLSVSLAIVAMKLRMRVRSDDDVGAALLPGVAAAAILVAFRHLSYAFVTLAPVAAWLLLAEVQPGKWQQRMFWWFQAGLIVDLPTLHRAVSRLGWSHPVADLMLPHADRVLLLGWTLVLLALAWWTVDARARRVGDSIDDLTVSAEQRAG